MEMVLVVKHVCLNHCCYGTVPTTCAHLRYSYFSQQFSYPMAITNEVRAGDAICYILVQAIGTDTKTCL